MTEHDTEDTQSITAESLYRQLAGGERITVLDVRNRDEFEAWHVDGPTVETVQLPHVEFIGAEVRNEVADLVAEAGLEDPIVAVCAEGKASAHVAQLLSAAGYNAANLEDGMEGWARVYVSSDIEAGTVGIRQYRRPSSGCLSYLVHEGAEAAIVDPLRAFADRYVADADALGVDLSYAIDTHVHADHLSGIRAVARQTGAEPVIPEAAVDRGLAFDARLLADGDSLDIGDAAIAAIHAPGHTSEMTALRVGGVLCSGDGLFLESVARPDLEQEAAARTFARRLYESLQRLLELPDETIVAPGHAGTDAVPAADGSITATLGEVRARVDLLNLDENDFVDRICSDMPPRPANHEAIIEANLGRRDVGAEEGFELELGPNNCAVSA